MANGDRVAKATDPACCSRGVAIETPYITNATALGSMIRHARGHAQLDGESTVLRGSGRRCVEVAHTTAVGTEPRPGANRGAPSARMILVLLLTGEFSENYVFP